MRAFNSTIKLKKKICSRCGKECFWFSNKRCKDCARIEDIMNEQEEETEQVIKEEGLQDLIKEADTVISTYVRMSAANKEGIAKCFTCSEEKRWQEMDAGHYVSRGCMFLRFDVLRNIRCQCQTCNRFKHGNILSYSKALESELPGVTDILAEESRLIYHYGRDEIKALINEFKLKIKKLQSGN